MLGFHIAFSVTNNEIYNAQVQVVAKRKKILRINSNEVSCSASEDVPDIIMEVKRKFAPKTDQLNYKLILDLRYDT